MGAIVPYEVELEPEVRDWYLALDHEQQGRVDLRIDRLAREGPLLGEPHTRQLVGKLRELRFHLRGRDTRIMYWIAPGRRVILLTVFVKTKRRERRQIDRARRALERCVVDQHTVEDGDD